MRQKKKWNEYSEQQQRAIVVGGAIETVLTAIALVDLARRPADQVRGSRAAWALAVFVQPVGPIAYLALGRRPVS